MKDRSKGELSDTDRSSMASASLSPALQYKIPFLLLLICLIALPVAFVGTLAWFLTYRSATSSLEYSSTSLVYLATNEIAGQLSTHIKTLASIHFGLRDYWRQGFFQDDRNQTMKAMLTALIRDDILTALGDQIGEIWGWVVNHGPDGNITQMGSWQQWGLNYTHCNTTLTGTVQSCDPWTDTEANNNTGYWFDLDLNDPNAFIITPPFVWTDGNQYVSFLSSTYGPTGEFAVVVGNDWNLNLISTLASSLSYGIPFRNHIYMIDNTPPVFGVVRCIYFNESADPLMEFMTSKIDSLYHGDISAVTTNDFSETVAGAKWFLQMRQFPLGYGVNWVIFEALDYDNVLQHVNSESKVTGAVVAAVVAGIAVIASAFAIMISREFMAVISQIKILSKMRFQEVIDREGFKKISFIREMAHLQTVFHKMVQIFAESLKTHKSVTGQGGVGHGATSGTGGASGGNSGSHKQASLTHKTATDQGSVGHNLTTETAVGGASRGNSITGRRLSITPPVPPVPPILKSSEL
ncbi:hypothetical protein HK101_003232 [Irineochytrium annulatum]|nr:hypothetical protein HK101_003232 [Irineochytrium annulatum]